MTCIVALVHENKVLFGGDASASDDKSGLIFQRHDPKVFKVGQFGIGFVDSFRMGQILHPHGHTCVGVPRKSIAFV